MVGHLLTLNGNQHFRKNETVSDKIPQNPANFSSQRIHTFGVTSSLGPMLTWIQAWTLCDDNEGGS